MGGGAGLPLALALGVGLGLGLALLGLGGEGVFLATLEAGFFLVGLGGRFGGLGGGVLPPLSMMLLPVECGVRVEWRDGGGPTRLLGVTELGRLMATDPDLALTVLDSLGRWEAGRSAGGMDPQRKGGVRLQDRAGETSNSSGGRLHNSARWQPKNRNII